ncbi:MAG: hypothetical protein V7784_04725 [Oceanospirillaceae bacterium]
MTWMSNSVSFLIQESRRVFDFVELISFGDQSFRVLLTPLTYTHAGKMKVSKAAPCHRWRIRSSWHSAIMLRQFSKLLRLQYKGIGGFVENLELIMFLSDYLPRDR